MADTPETASEVTLRQREEAQVRHIVELAKAERMLQWFRWAHLPSDLQIISCRFADLAVWIVDRIRGPERTVALRKLLEAKDCAVRAQLEEPHE